MRNLLISALAAAAVLLSACGHVHADPAGHRPGPISAAALLESIARAARSQSTAPAAGSTTVRFQDTQYYATIVGAGSPQAYMYFSTAIRDTEVMPSSAARITVTTTGQPQFVSPAQRAHWTAAGRPLLPGPGQPPEAIALGPGQFTFTPQGTDLTFAQARSLPATPSAIRAGILSHLRPYAGPRPPAALVLKQFGFLLAAAPLTPGARAAAWTALASMAGLRRCGTGTDLLGRHGQAICADSSQYNNIKVLISPGSGSVLAVEEYIAKASPLYPALPAHTLIESDTFTQQS